MNSTKFIVKIQVSIASSDKKSLTLIYNQDRSIEAEFETNPDILKIMGKELKLFSYAHIDDKGGMVLDNKAPNQTW